MRQIEMIILWLYTQLLKLYPSDFYEQFADEMLDTLQERLDDSSINKLWLGWHEIVGLIMGIIREYRRSKYQQHGLSLRFTVGVLLLPVIAGSVLLMLRYLGIFFLPGKTWWLFGALTIGIAFLGYVRGQQAAVLALPLVGFMLSILLRIFWNTITPHLRYGTPWWFGPSFTIVALHSIGYVVLMIVLFVYTQSRQAIPSYRWLAYMLALPIVGILSAIFVVYATGVHNENLPLLVIIRGHFLHVLLMPGTLSLIMLASLPIASRIGSHAILIMVGYLFSEMVGLAATFPNMMLQRVGGLVFLLLFFTIIPMLVVWSRQVRKWPILLLVALSYGFIFAVKFFTADFRIETTFTLYRIGEMLQILIMLAFALDFFRLLPTQRKNKAPESPAEIPQHRQQMTTA